MSEEYPLFPTLHPEAAEEAQVLMDSFKVKMRKLCDETLGELYVNVTAYIESDHWLNYRNDLLAGLCNYRNRKIQASCDFARIRRAIFEQYRDEIIADLNHDLLKELEETKKRFQEECDRNRMR